MKSKGDSTLYQAIMSVQQSEPIKETRALDRLQQEAESLSPFAEYYDKLNALPRRIRRSLQRQWKRSLAGIALLLALGQAPTLAATIQVGGRCTLVDAINAANSDTAQGGCTRGVGNDIIVLPNNTSINLTHVAEATYGPAGLPVITGQVTIAGNGSTIRRVSGTPEFKIFVVGGAGDLTLERVTISNGVGSGIFSDSGEVTLVQSTVSGNDGDGVTMASIYIYDGESGIHVQDSTISGNTRCGILTTVSGGVVSNSTISDNAGPGICANNEILRVVNSTLSGNAPRSSQHPFVSH